MAGLSSLLTCPPVSSQHRFFVPVLTSVLAPAPSCCSSVFPVFLLRSSSVFVSMHHRWSVSPSLTPQSIIAWQLGGVGLGNKMSHQAGPRGRLLSESSQSLEPCVLCPSLSGSSMGLPGFASAPPGSLDVFSSRAGQGPLGERGLVLQGPYGHCCWRHADGGLSQAPGVSAPGHPHTPVTWHCASPSEGSR